MPVSLSRNARVIALIAGFVFATLGTLWSFLVTDSLSAETARLSDGKAALVQEMGSLNSLASDYFIANQQGDLIFMLALQGNARADLAELIYRGNMLDRATPVRNMIGALGVAGQLDFNKTYGDYAALNDKTRADLTFENYTELKVTEQDIINRGQERARELLNQIFEVDKAINAKQAEQSRNRAVGLIAALLGSALLLGANLMAERGKADEKNGE